MKILMEPTKHVVMVDGVECRIWNAVTESDIQCYVFVHRIAVRKDVNNAEFEEMLYDISDDDVEITEL